MDNSLTPKKGPGHPRRWESVEEIIPIIDEYFRTTDPVDITLTGLCIALKTNKQTLANYQQLDDFKEVLDMAKMRIENAYEKGLKSGACAGSIFALKNFGWRDKQEIDQNNNVRVQFDAAEETDI